jgi:hypothetical protein
VFQERSIRRLTFNPGSVQVFDTSIVEENRGDRGQEGPVDPLRPDRLRDAAGEEVEAVGIQEERPIAVRDVYGPRVFFCYRTRAADPAQRSLLDAALIYW